MKSIVLFLATALGITSLSAQTPPAGTISQPPLSSGSGTATLFTNASGATYSADQLATQLRELRNTLDRTLPVLSAATETFSNANANQSVAGRIEDLLAGARKRNSREAGSQSSFHLTNLLSTVDRLLHTNSPAGSAVSTTTVKDLENLQGQLQAVSATLQSLNVGSSFNNTPALTPTGR